MRWTWLTLPLVACSPSPTEAVPCPSEPPGEGEVVVTDVTCRAQLLPGGEGGGVDVYVANSRFRGILRHPQAALTVPGLGGGTLIDAAPWDRPDRLHEVVPLIEGGWLDVDDYTVEPDGLVVSGELRALPDRPIAATGRRTAAWRLRPDDPWLHLEGADGLYLHVDAPMVLADGWLADDQVVYGHDGVLETDLGGAVRITGATKLLVASPADAWAERPGPLVHVSGTAPDAAQVEAFRDGARVAVVPVVDDAFDALLPADVTGLRALAPGRAPGNLVAPGEDLTLAPGPSGAVRLRFDLGRAPRRPIPVSWTAADGRVGETRVDPDGATVTTGGGVVDLVVGARPYVFPKALRVEVPPGGTVDLSVTLADGVVPARHVLADLAWPGSRDRGVRDTALDRTREAVGEGLAYVVTTARDDVETTAIYVDDVLWIRFDDGLVLTHPDGWSIGSWPWRATVDASGHGAPRALELSPERAFDAAWGGPPIHRLTRVDLPWMRAVTQPLVDFATEPDFVALDPPGPPPFDAWSPWFAWLDLGRFVRPSGSRDWLDVGAVATYSRVDVDRALQRGALCAGTGGFVDVRVDGAAPGQIVPRPKPVDTGDTDPSDSDDTDGHTDAPVSTDHDVQVFVDRGPYALDRMTVFTEGVGEVGTFEIDRDGWNWSGRASLGTWTIVVAWSTTTDAWAVTAPVWTRDPGVGVIPGKPAAR
jgi:hypothetical protein